MKLGEKKLITCKINRKRKSPNVNALRNSVITFEQIELKNKKTAN